MIVIKCITANFAQIMTWRFTGEDLAAESFPMPTQTQARCNSLLREQKELNLEKKNLLLREILSDETEDLIELHDCYRQT